MEFGKLSSLVGVDFRLPPEDPRTQRILQATGPGPLVASVGAAGWTTREWVGRVLPARTPPDHMLAEYARRLSGVELNATHYHVPDEATVLRWREQTPPGFRFSPKFPQEISHAPDLAAAAPRARHFAERMQLLGDRLGCAFLQLPPTMGPTHADALGELLSALPQGFHVAVEFRHPQWFRRQMLVSEAFSALAHAGASAVITDVGGRRDVVHASLPAPIAFVRFVGNALDPTDYERVDAWAERIAGWARLGLRELCFWVHQPDNVLAPELCNYVVRRLNQGCGLHLAEWAPPKNVQLSLL